MKLKIFLTLVLLLISASYLRSQVNVSHSLKQSKGFNLDLLSLGDTITYIKIMNDSQIEQLMDSLSTSIILDECMNGFAIEVMRSRLYLLEEISRRYCTQNTMDNIQCILYNFYYLTGIKHQSDHDFYGTTFISSHSISQYAEWLESNKERLCIDSDTRLLFIPHESK